MARDVNPHLSGRSSACRLALCPGSGVPGSDKFVATLQNTASSIASAAGSCMPVLKTGQREAKIKQTVQEKV